jgi:hypothetical protein
VRRAGLPRLSGGTDAGPGAAARRRLINNYGQIRQRNRPLRPEANARCDVPSVFLCLTCLAPSVDVLQRPLVCIVVVTHLVTHRDSDGSGPRTTSTTCHGPRLAMRDVIRWLVERRALQLVVAASAGDQELTHA